MKTATRHTFADSKPGRDRRAMRRAVIARKALFLESGLLPVNLEH